MNTRHAFRTGGNNTGDFLFQAFPQKTANVMLHMTALDFSGLSGEYQGTYNRPIHNGLWDAAFWKLGNVPLGFDFKGSPFGRDLFDLHTYFTLSGNLKYEDVFTGMVFYLPLGQHMVASSIPGYYDEAFKQTVLRRHGSCARRIISASRSLSKPCRARRNHSHHEKKTGSAKTRGNPGADWSSRSPTSAVLSGISSGPGPIF